MLLMLGRFVYSRLKSGLVQKLVTAVVLNWAALVTMASNRLIIRRCKLRSLSESLVLEAFAQEELQLLLDDDAESADAQGNSSIPARAVRMAATADERDKQVERVRCAVGT
jgi:hypothetical protein